MAMSTFSGLLKTLLGIKKGEVNLRVRKLGELLTNSMLTCKQAQKAMRVFESISDVQEAMLLTYPRLVDPWRFGDLMKKSLPLGDRGLVQLKLQSICKNGRR